MGANHSQDNDLGLWNSSQDKNVSRKHGPGMPNKQKSSVQGKPSPPCGVPIASDITHNSLKLSWQPPKSTNGGSILAYTIKMHIVKNHDWITLTKTCQGNNYLVKNLEPNSSYQFRVRAENIYGRSKPSKCSEFVETNNLNFQKLPSPVTERKSPSLKRRHSVNIHVEGRVANILNHTDPVVKTSVSSGALHEKSATFQRDITFRSSLQTTRKRSVNSILPGTKTDSLLRLKDSQSKLSSKNSCEDITRSCSHESSIDRIETESNTDNQSEISDNFLRDVQSHNGDINETDDSEKRTSSEFSESASGDLKIVLSPRLKNYDNVESCVENGTNEDDIVFESRQRSPHDFRTLRNMLNSSDIIIKSSRSLPEISEVYKSFVTPSHKLSTIIDEDMDDDSVQVTTL